MKTKEQIEQEREDARRFILDSVYNGVDPVQILDELSTFYDGDPIDLLF